jgi:hypothetical protein
VVVAEAQEETTTQAQVEPEAVAPVVHRPVVVPQAAQMNMVAAAEVLHPEALEVPEETVSFSFED